MVKFQHRSGLEYGLDIKTAGELVKEALKLSGKVTMRTGSRQGDAKLIFNVMSLGIKKGDLIEFSVEGDNEEAEAGALERFVREQL